jgi:hypothetical protein
MKTKFIIALFSVLILMSCQNIKNNNYNNQLVTIKVNDTDFKNNGKLSTIVSNITIVPLETNDSCLIISINKVVNYKNTYYVFDKSAQNIFKFSQSGKFLSKIGRRGDGPGEFLEIHDFLINEESNSILISDYFKVHEYSLDGKFIGDFKTDILFSKFIKSPGENKYYCFGTQDDRLSVASCKFELEQSYFKNSTNDNGVVSHHFIGDGSLILFHLSSTNDTIYSLQNHKPIPYYNFDFGNKKYLNNEKKEFVGNELNKFLYDGCNCISCYTFIPTQNFIFIQLKYSKNIYSGFYNKSTRKVKFINHNKFKNDIFNSFFYFNPVGTDTNSYIVSLPAEKLIENKKFIMNQPNSNELNKLTNYSNPVLLIAQPNDN